MPKVVTSRQNIRVLVGEKTALALHRSNQQPIVGVAGR